jgi:hypothetical protein
MLVVDPQFMVDQIKANDAQYWKLLSGGKLITKQGQDIGLDTSIAILEDALNNASGGIVEVVASDKPDGEKARGGKVVNYTYKIDLRNGAPVAVDSGIGGLGESSSEVWELKQRIRDMEWQQKLDAAIEKASSPLNGIREHPAFMPAVMGLLNKFMGPKQAIPVQGPAVNGTAQETHEIEQGEKLAAALHRLAAVDPNLPETMEMLADYAEKNPEQYKSFIPMLKNM